jgi:uncharacterized protein YbbC (DUF1343 family)
MNSDCRACISEAVHSQPTFQKHGGVTCGGVQIHVLDRNSFEPWFAGIAMAKFAHDMYPE